MQDNNDMRRILENLNKGDNMPIQKNRSKDLPGKTGWSQNDREKLIDVIKNPGNYGVDPNDTEEPNCLDKMFQFAFLAIGLTSLLFNILKG